MWGGFELKQGDCLVGLFSGPAKRGEQAEV